MLDKTAQNEAYKVAKRLAPYMDVKIAQLARSKDPGEADRIELAQAINCARYGLETLL